MNTETACRDNPAPESADVENNSRGRCFSPPADIIENEQEVLVRMDVPGASADDISIDYELGRLSVHAKVAPRMESDDRRFILREYGVGDYCRSFRVGDRIDADRIQAEVGAGVLTLRLPKLRAAAQRKISVQAAH